MNKACKYCRHIWVGVLVFVLYVFTANGQEEKTIMEHASSIIAALWWVIGILAAIIAFGMKLLIYDLRKMRDTLTQVQLDIAKLKGIEEGRRSHSVVSS